MPINVVFSDGSKHLAGKYRLRNNVKIEADMSLITNQPGDVICHCYRVRGLLEAFGVMPVSGELTFVIKKGRVKTSGTLTKHSDRIGSEPEHLVAKVEKTVGDIARDYGQSFQFMKWDMTQSCDPPNETSATAEA